MLDLIYNQLSNDATLTSLVSSRIYPYIIEEEVTTPAVMFTLESVIPLNTMEGDAKAETYQVVVTSISKRAGEAQQLMNIVRATLDSLEGEYTLGTGNSYTVADSRMSGMNMDSLYNGRLFVAEVEFNIDTINP